MSFVVLIFCSWVILEIVWELNRNIIKNKMKTKKTQLIDLGFEFKDFSFTMKDYRLKRENFFMCYDKEEKLHISQSEDDYLNYNGITIEKASIEDIKKLIVIMS